MCTNRILNVRRYGTISKTDTVRLQLRDLIIVFYTTSIAHAFWSCTLNFQISIWLFPAKLIFWSVEVTNFNTNHPSVDLIKPNLRNFILILSYILSFAIVTTSDYLTVNHDKCDYRTIWDRAKTHLMLYCGLRHYVYPEVYHEVYRDTCVYHHSFNSHHTEMNSRSTPITMIKMWKRW